MGNKESRKKQRSRKVDKQRSREKQKAEKQTGWKAEKQGKPEKRRSREAGNQKSKTLNGKNGPPFQSARLRRAGDPISQGFIPYP